MWRATEAPPPPTPGRGPWRTGETDRVSTKKALAGSSPGHPQGAFVEGLGRNGGWLPRSSPAVRLALENPRALDLNGSLA